MHVLPVAKELAISMARPSLGAHTHTHTHTALCLQLALSTAAAVHVVYLAS